MYPLPCRVKNVTEVGGVLTKIPVEKITTANLLKRLWLLLSLRRKRQLFGLFVLMILSAVSETVSLGAVLPFIGVLTAPDKIYQFHFVATFVNYWGISSPHDLKLAFTILFVFSAICAACLRMLLLWVNARFALSLGGDIGIEVYKRTLNQPYKMHVARNSSKILSGILYKSGQVTNIFVAVLNLVSASILLGAIVVTLFVMDPLIASISALSFGVCYGFIAIISRKKMYACGQFASKQQTQILKALQEGLGGIRDILLDGTQSLYCSIYRNADIPNRRIAAIRTFITQSPRYIMEAFGMILIAGLAYLLNARDGGVGAALPSLGALALGAQRLLPALQQIYTGYSSIIEAQAPVGEVLELVEEPSFIMENLSNVKLLKFENKIEIKNVCFHYTQDGPLILDKINLSISKGKRIGIMGTTGSGKSTLLDILMGLFEANHGNLLIDDQIITRENVFSWQRCIAHVPQNIYLADITLAENIAFGIPLEQINMERVNEAAKQAQIADFIESNPQGYTSFVGERGVRLSGGQRQRIGLARALYKKAPVLILDEATSALDNATEEEVMRSIEGLSRDLTIIVVAHRLSTLRYCDHVIRIEKGRLVKEGSYQEIINDLEKINLVNDANIELSGASS